ncbi:MAG: hypothetical protein HUJ27_10770 [Rhodobacteraceae bacterium]|nr:hypothetical protein [Paracoccaceae bacterium]
MTTIDMLIDRIRELQDQLEEDLTEKRETLRYRIQAGRIEFEDEMRRRHRELRESWRSYLSRARPLVILTAPIIYSVVAPLAILDLGVTLYQRICFPVYGIPIVRRREYVVIDRHMLGYLNWLQKVNCVYCGYGNGVLAYAREIAARTEQYWCPIKHASRVQDPHMRYPNFSDFGDGEGFQGNWRKLREELNEEKG